MSLSLPVLKGHQIDSFSQFLIADGTVSLPYRACLVSVAENGFTDLWVHSGPTGIGFPGVTKSMESGWWIQAYGSSSTVGLLKSCYINMLSGHKNSVAPGFFWGFEASRGHP